MTVSFITTDLTETATRVLGDADALIIRASGSLKVEGALVVQLSSTSLLRVEGTLISDEVSGAIRATGDGDSLIDVAATGSILTFPARPLISKPTQRCKMPA